MSAPSDSMAPMYPAADVIGETVRKSFINESGTFDPRTCREIGMDVLRKGFPALSLSFWYKNYRGETAKRAVVPVRLYYGATEYHPEPQWLLEAYDVERQAPRDFAVKDITFGSPAFQLRVQDWMQACFGPKIASDTIERNHRFFEEAGELVQANGMTREECHQLVDYVFDRPVGEKKQEVGGVMVTLAALCETLCFDMMEAGETELARVWTKIDKIREKQATKPTHSALPQRPDLVAEYGEPVILGWDLGWERPRDCHNGCVSRGQCLRRPACDDPPGSL